MSWGSPIQQKYETHTNQGRTSRERRVSTVRVGSVEKSLWQSIGTSLLMPQAPNISAIPGKKSAGENPYSDLVGGELEEYLRGKEPLRESILQSIKKLTKTFPNAEIEAFLEYDPEDEETKRPILEVRTEFEEIDEYRELKEEVRKIVRNSEQEDTMIYTRIDQV